MLYLNRIRRTYGDTVALDGLDLAVPDNTYMSLLGASGSGKTTLLRLIAGFEEPDHGEITLNGERLDGQPSHLRDIGFVFQNFALFPHLSVFENVAFGLRYREARAVKDPREIKRRVEDTLDLVGLSELSHRSVSEISGGQRQRVALARTLVCEPRIVLLDEPLGALDANLRTQMCNELKAIRQRLNVSFLHVTGSETEALTMGDRVAVLSGGSIVQVDSPDHLFSNPDNVAAARHLNAWNIFDAGLLRGGSETGRVAVRFDQMDVCSPVEAPENRPHLTAKYLTGEFNGPTALSFFRLQDGTLVQVIDHLSEPRLPNLTEGDSYVLHFAPEVACEFKGAA